MNAPIQQKPAVEYFLIGKAFAEIILNYLAKRPYIEVAQMIQGLEKLPPITTVTTPEAKETESSGTLPGF